MANSRLEKIGTIYTRTKGLLNSKAMSWSDRPIWYDVYEAFPPKEEPSFDRPAPNMPLKKIFYHEDNIRAMFHKNNKQIGTTNIFNNASKTLTQKFIDVYDTLKMQYKDRASQEQLYQEAVETLQRERQKQGEMHDETISLSSSFKEAQEQKQKEPSVNIKVKDIFND